MTFSALFATKISRLLDPPRPSFATSRPTARPEQIVVEPDPQPEPSPGPDMPLDDRAHQAIAAALGAGITGYCRAARALGALDAAGITLTEGDKP